MQISIGLPMRVAGVSSGFLLDWARRADEGPFASLVALDRVVNRSLEPLTVLAAAAGVTRRIRLMTSILLAPTRETTLLARQAASLDALSDGRLSLGIGIGIRESDYTATGFDFHRRGRREEEQLEILRRLWRGEALAEGIGPIGPAPARPGGPEVLLGGYVPAIAGRIARWGDGFMAPGGGEPAAMAELWALINREWEAAGRTGRPRWVGATYYALGPDADTAAAEYIHHNYGFDPALAARRLRTLPKRRDEVEAAIVAQAALGVDELILRPITASWSMLDELAGIAVAMGLGGG
jgi:alkanesulfonate monooxygenase SsuD/methylene tetrahydromethanopterin reductase-like flavin-dependent oxidoreductase (luciferase family)